MNTIRSMRSKFSFSTVALLVIALCMSVVMLPHIHDSSILLAQANLKQPNVTARSATVIGWTAGTLNNGGHAVTVIAGTASVTTSMSTCASPGYTACNFVYSDSSGTVSVTTTRATAFNTGNTLMAYVETSGSAITKLAYPQQANTVAAAGTQLTDCISSLTCASTVQTFGAGIITQMGTAALTGGSATISGMSPAYASSSSYGCTTIFISGTSTGVDPMLFTPVSTTSFTITANAAVNQNIHWMCIGR